MAFQLPLKWNNNEITSKAVNKLTVSFFGRGGSFSQWSLDHIEEITWDVLIIVGPLFFTFGKKCQHSSFCSYVLNLQMLCEPPSFQSFIKILEILKPHYENICKLVGKELTLYYHVNQPWSLFFLFVLYVQKGFSKSVHFYIQSFGLTLYEKYFSCPKHFIIYNVQWIYHILHGFSFFGHAGCFQVFTLWVSLIRNFVHVQWAPPSSLSYFNFPH